MTESNEWTDWIPDIERVKRMQADIDALKCERAKLVEERDELIGALEPFASTASHDIGDDETNNDVFRPMHRYFESPLITVGDMRRAYSLVSRYRS